MRGELLLGGMPPLGIWCFLNCTGHTQEALTGAEYKGVVLVAFSRNKCRNKS